MEPPTWRMTQCEAQVLKDLDSFAKELRYRDVPQTLLIFATSARKDGQAWKIFRPLVERGFLTYDREHETYRRTDKQIPVGHLNGEKPDALPPGIIFKLAQAWRKGQRVFTQQDLATHLSSSRVPKHGTKRT